MKGGIRVGSADLPRTKRSMMAKSADEQEAPAHQHVADEEDPGIDLMVDAEQQKPTDSGAPPSARWRVSGGMTSARVLPISS